MKDPFSVYNSNFEKKTHRPKLDWEEGALFQASEPDDYYEGQSEDSRITFYVSIVVLVFLVLFGRLIVLQIAQGEHFRTLADQNRLRVQAIIAPRGIIYDSQGKQLVENVPSFELVVTPADLPKDYQSSVIALSSLMGFEADSLLAEIQKKSSTSYQPISVMQNLPKDYALLFESKASQFPGFAIEHNPIRQYPDPLIFSHLLGYTGKITDQELSNQEEGEYAHNDYIGKTGIEAEYEKYLRGVAGKKQVEVDAKGNLKSLHGQIDPEPGNSLILNIDLELQKELYKNIVAHNGNKKAAAIALDPQNGKVLALVSLPGFDNNLFAQGISQKDYLKLTTDPKKPLFNRAISGTYPPGSTIKPVIASAALQEGVVDDKTVIYDNGDLVYGGFHFRGWKESGLGPMTVRTAISMSSDIYFYTVGGGQSALNIAGLGPERLSKYDKLFGMGSPLGIDLPSEAAGLVADPYWKKNHFDTKEMQIWYPGDTYHVSIGQGDMLATPLQVAMWTSVVANGGTLYRPYILDRVTDVENKVIFEKKQEVIRSDFIDPKNIEIVREGMRMTVTQGTARSLSTLPITAAGKTGTAQFDSANPGATHAWFTAFAPYENPRIVITVLIEAGGEGSLAASPVVKETLLWWAEHRNK
ncbi:MAG: penicillin-binding protein 2 [Candidatus Doudnabacteria bacterium]